MILNSVEISLCAMTLSNRKNKNEARERKENKSFSFSYAHFTHRFINKKTQTTYLPITMIKN